VDSRWHSARGGYRLGCGGGWGFGLPGALGLGGLEGPPFGFLRRGFFGVFGLRGGETFGPLFGAAVGFAGLFVSRAPLFSPRHLHAFHPRPSNSRPRTACSLQFGRRLGWAWC